MQVHDPFSRLVPFIREYIYKQHWTELRGIQEAAVTAVLDGDGHLLIAAPTASGKTEAAFFPVLSCLFQSPAPSVGLLYIGPLKALINDQFERLTRLLSPRDMPVQRWHGDVADHEKKRLLEHPRGLLQITPESLEALLLGHPEKIPSLFKGLAFVIVDEVHAFMGSDRGAQILCHLTRITDLAGCTPRRIGLSATLGDYQEAMDWLALGSDKKTTLIRDEYTRQRIKIALDYFRPPAAAYYHGLYEQCHDRKCIIFTNTRLEAEETIAALRTVAQRRHEGDIFHVHHGSISRVLRLEAERELKHKAGPTVIAATQTLELGIDIGKLDRIIQIGPPVSVSSFVQRLGRAGRRTGVAEIYFTFLEEEALEEPAARIPWTLLHTIAVIQLHLEEKWIETAPAQPFPYSLLLHQTLSILASLGEQRPPDLARRVLSLPPFALIPLEDYRELLRMLLEQDYIEKTDEGALILGLGAEPLVNHYSFYAVFSDEEEYRVIYEGTELGTVNFLPNPGSSLALAGSYWHVEICDMHHKKVFVLPAKTGGEKPWRGNSADLHPRIVQRMRRVLAEQAIYPYLSESARIRLQEARLYARRIRLIAEGCTDEQGSGFHFRYDEGVVLIPWLGSRGMRTLLAILQHQETKERLDIHRLYRENNYSIYTDSALPLALFREELYRIIRDIPSAEILVDQDKIPFTEKYDYLLSPRLLTKQYIAHRLDMAEVKAGIG
ncbi:MAG: DEAD/DEAH box helicase [Treponema sp.]|jgi:ATP-dependent Lhr-like helicase|nr:DEAD/DEAH box helicase [Treponema sp.]